jgi:hypothetical protein
MEDVYRISNCGQLQYVADRGTGGWRKAQQLVSVKVCMLRNVTHGLALRAVHWKWGEEKFFQDFGRKI